MKTKTRARHALLPIALAAVLMSPIAIGTPSAPPVLSKSVSGAVAGSSDSSNEEMVSRLIVKHRAHRTDKLDTALRATDTSGLAISSALQMAILRPMSGGAHVVSLDQPVTLTQARAIAERLMHDSDIELAEPDQIMRISTTLPPNDPLYLTRQWHYKAPVAGNTGGANLPDAWGMTLGASADPLAPIIVAVLDTGYRQHADLATVLPGYDFIANGAVANDTDGRDTDALDPGDWVATEECGAGTLGSNSSWHGTHVAGTVAATMSNSVGVTGIAPEVKILPVRVIGKCGGFTSDIVDGMRWAAGIHVDGVPDNLKPAHVLNMSLGGSGTCSAVFQSAVNDVLATNKTRAIVAAAGNDGSVGLNQPANCTGVIAVTAHAIDGDNANYANIGTQTALSAPGGGCGTMAAGCTAFASANGPGVYSLSNAGSNGPGGDSYVARQGTSMATPHVSGVIALMLALKPALAPAQIKSYLQSSARAHPAGTTCAQTRYAGLCGEGMLDAFGAVNKANAHAPIVSLAKPYQVVAPNAVVSLSSTDTVSPGTVRSITSYTWSQQSGVSVGAINASNSANATFTAPVTGIYTFRHTVTDDTGETGSATATVRVNSPPNLIPVPDQTVEAGSSVSFAVAAVDPDGDAVAFSIESFLPESATLDPATGAFRWPNAVPGTHSLAYRAGDRDGAYATGTVKITVAGSGGGGSIDGGALAGMALLVAVLRLRRSRNPIR